MRRNIVHDGSGRLTYEIREIVEVAFELEALGRGITWENIGDPIHKGERWPAWMKQVVAGLVADDITYGYVDTRGVKRTREFLAEIVNRRDGCRITPNDILFFNGLGDAVAKVFGFLKREARVICPSPSYSTHSSGEAAHSGYEPLTYELDPARGWMPDLEDLENKVKYNDSIAGILLINPDNPTGTVYPAAILESLVDIARRYGLFILCDEIYSYIVYDGTGTKHLSEVIGEVPGIALRGISKEYPWPGSRCGWIEVYNQDSHPQFRQYVDTLLAAKRLEVCSTSLPQYAIPPIMGDPRYADHLRMRRRIFAQRADEAYGFFSGIEGISVVKPQGAFYMSIIFDPGILNDRQQLKIDNRAVRENIESRVRTVQPDKRFVYYLLGATGICVVPMTGFCCTRHGFRVTMLECDDAKRRWTWETIAESIREYLRSG
ncbi:MAG TPA: pyridoxal phosphate-dependent aminotransferase [bacterium]|nr:pyridoxal phosphate-dependent aminotransferase [bacterium]